MFHAAHVYCIVLCELVTFLHTKQFFSTTLIFVESPYSLIKYRDTFRWACPLWMAAVYTYGDDSRPRRQDSRIQGCTCEHGGVCPVCFSSFPKSTTTAHNTNRQWDKEGHKGVLEGQEGIQWWNPCDWITSLWVTPNTISHKKKPREKVLHWIQAVIWESIVNILWWIWWEIKTLAFLFQRKGKYTNLSKKVEI